MVIGAGKNRRGRLVHWVEKASLEKIRQLLEISEQERHYEVLLTPKNLANVRRNLTLYSLPIIPRPLPSKIVDGEHFVTVDLLNLTAGSGSSSRVTDAETSSRYRPKSLLLPKKGTNSGPRVLKTKNGGTSQRRNVPGAQVKDFIPWIHPESSRPVVLEEEEEEEEMTGLLERYATRKQKRQESAEREADQAEGSNRPFTDGGSEM